MEFLQDRDLLFFNNEGNLQPVEDFDQMQALKRQKLEDSQSAEEIQRQMSNLQDQGPDAQRRRAGQQLELNDQMFEQNPEQIPRVAQQQQEH